jgi:hypothetical protein
LDAIAPRLIEWFKMLDVMDYFVFCDLAKMNVCGFRENSLTMGPSQANTGDDLV